MVSLRFYSLMLLFAAGAVLGQQNASTIACNDQQNASTINGTVAKLNQADEKCSVAPSEFQDRRPDKSRLKYATFNVEWLFLSGGRGIKCPGEGCDWKNHDTAMRHVRQIAKRVLQVDADIFQFDEVEDCNVLQVLNDELRKLGDNTFVPYLVPGADSSTGQNVALLTRVDPITDVVRTDAKVSFPISDSTCPGTSRGGSKGVTKNLIATFNVDGFRKPVSVVAGHLLAIPTDKKRCFEREAQASVLANEASAKFAANHHVIVSGDMNDWSNIVVDRNNNRPISNAMGVIESAGLSHVGVKVAQEERYSHWWDRNKNCVFEMNELSTLDHIFVSKELFESMSSVKYHTDLYQGQCESLESDHYPISVTFQREN